MFETESQVHIQHAGVELYDPFPPEKPELMRLFRKNKISRSRSPLKDNMSLNRAEGAHKVKRVFCRPKIDVVVDAETVKDFKTFDPSGSKSFCHKDEDKRTRSLRRPRSVKN